MFNREDEEINLYRGTNPEQLKDHLAETYPNNEPLFFTDNKGKAETFARHSEEPIIIHYEGKKAHDDYRKVKNKEDEYKIWDADLDKFTVYFLDQPKNNTSSLFRIDEPEHFRSADYESTSLEQYAENILEQKEKIIKK